MALRAGAALILVTAVWSMYAFGAFALVWHPTLLDGVIPFAFGATEVLLCLSIAENMARWLGFAASAALMAFITLLYIYRKAPRNTRNAGVFASVMQRRRVNYLPLMATFVLFGLWILTVTGTLSGSNPIGPVLALVFFTGFLLNTGMHWRRLIHYLRQA